MSSCRVDRLVSADWWREGRSRWNSERSPGWRHRWFVVRRNAFGTRDDCSPPVFEYLPYRSERYLGHGCVLELVTTHWSHWSARWRNGRGRCWPVDVERTFSLRCIVPRRWLKIGSVGDLLFWPCCRNVLCRVGRTRGTLVVSRRYLLVLSNRRRSHRHCVRRRNGRLSLTRRDRIRNALDSCFALEKPFSVVRPASVVNPWWLSREFHLSWCSHPFECCPPSTRCISEWLECVQRCQTCSG